ncbi:AraC-like DNA-binding protein [Bosea sp. BE125]|uniref:helix-turn-helix transcriptional regulator n=1 Tax=Bosea sp. BE125 TaxID=2817909 RepID=UPI00286197F2|nr:AraC family transcriptional regulator [Bosea sp. BE125]MDR6874046.1 AraC-like DNA-binding protein [Bosea sp. BE125]
MQEPVLDFGEKLPPGINPGIRRALVHIERHFTDSVYLEDLAVLAGLSVCRFVTVFRRQVGLTPHRFICHRRIRHAKALLREGVPMAQAASEAGFFDQSHLSRHFKSICGVTPGRYLRDLAQPERPRAARGGYVQAVAV